MKKLATLAISVILFGLNCFGQTPQRTQRWDLKLGNSYTADGFNIANQNVGAHIFVWSLQTGVSTSCTLSIQTSSNNATWATQDTENCNSNGQTAYLIFTANFVRVKITSLVIQISPISLTVNYNGYIIPPTTIATITTAPLNTQQNIGNIRYCGNFSGADYGLKIRACVNDLPTAGGIVTYVPSALETLSATTNFLSGVTVNCEIWLAGGSYALTQTLTVPSNIKIKFLQGASFAIASGKRIDFLNIGLEAGPYQIFSGTGTVHFSSVAPVVLPQWWGAVGDNVTDSTSAINAAIQSLAASGGLVRFAAGSYILTSSMIGAIGVSIVGDNPYNTVLNFADCNGFDLSGLYSSINQLSISNISLNGTSGTTFTGIYQSGDDVQLDQLYGVTIGPNVYVSNFNIGIKAKNAWLWKVYNNWFQYINSGAVLLGEDFDWYIYGNRFVLASGNGSGASNGILLGDATFNSGGTTVKPEGIQIYSNKFNGFITSGFNCDDCIASNFYLNDIVSLGSGVRISGNAGNNTVRDNTIELHTSAATAGVLLWNQASVLPDGKINVENNHISTDATTTTANCISIGTPGTANQGQLNIKGNQCSTFSSYDIVGYGVSYTNITENTLRSTGLAVSVYITSSTLGGEVHIDNNNYLAGYIKVDSGQKGQVIVGCNGGVYSTCVHGKSIWPGSTSSITTTFASLLGTGAIPNFAAAASTGCALIGTVKSTDASKAFQLGGISASQITWTTIDSSNVSLSANLWWDVNMDCNH